LKNKLIKLKKQDGTLWLGHGTCSYISVYINAVAESVILCSQHEFCNIIFKIKHLFIASAPTPQWKIVGAHLSACVLNTGKSREVYILLSNECTLLWGQRCGLFISECWSKEWLSCGGLWYGGVSRVWCTCVCVCVCVRVFRHVAEQSI
jgi:hypothetical protein